MADHGPVRAALEALKAYAAATELTLEQAADVYDRLVALRQENEARKSFGDVPEAAKKWTQ